MMWAAILAAASVATPTPPATTAPTASQASPTAVAGELSPAEQLRQLREIYAQSCGDRAYGSFEDACHDMSKHIRDVEKSVRKQQEQDAKRR